MFKFLRKKRGVMDLRHGKGGEEDIPIPLDIKKRIENTIAKGSIRSSGHSVSDTGSASSPSFFDGFFGSGEETQAVESTAERLTASADERISNLSDKFSRIEQRLEFIERKVDRLERGRS